MPKVAYFMNIAVVGTGYVGTTLGALFADRGNNAVCIDRNPAIVDSMRKGEINFFEPGLEEIVAKNIAEKRLTATTEISAVQDADVIFLAVGTPSREDGSFDTDALITVAYDVGTALQDARGEKTIVTKSTVPQGTYKQIIESVEHGLFGHDLAWDYAMIPETLAEGTAVKDFSQPDRIIIGTESDTAYSTLVELFHPFIRKGGNRVIRGTPADAELAKLMSNTALATRIAMVNEFARIADNTPGADMEIIREMISSDNRIGYNFMFPSPGYGGSCFPKDIQGMVHQSAQDGYTPVLLSHIHESNERHKQYIGEKVATETRGTIGVWGLTFKPGTDDMRDAASIPILTHLINQGMKVQAYDPQDTKAREIFGDRITFCDSAYDAAENAQSLLLLTEWKEFHSPDFRRLRETMSGTTLFDMRNFWLAEAANRAGFNYYGVGRNYPL